MHIFDTLTSFNSTGGERQGDFLLLWHQWARRDLQRGDLSALLALTNNGRWDDPNPVRLQRLSKRGFIKTREDDKLQVTMKGRAALLFGRRWGAPGH